MENLTLLAARLEAATGADRELDADLEVALLGGRIEWVPVNYIMEARPVVLRASPDHVRGFSKEPVPTYTASIDAALALLGRAAPEKCVENLGEMSDAGSLTGRWLAQLRPRGPRPRCTSLTAEGLRAAMDADEPVDGATPALALSLAVVSALAKATSPAA